MKTRLCAGLLALAITLFALPSMSTVGQTPGSSRIEQATNEYRQFYNSRYEAARQIALGTNEYRLFYGPR